MEWLRDSRSKALLLAELWDWMLGNAPLAIWQSWDNMFRWARWWPSDPSFAPTFSAAEKRTLSRVFFGRFPIAGVFAPEARMLTLLRLWWVLDMEWYRSEALRRRRGIPPSGIIGIRSTTGSGFAGAWWARRGQAVVDSAIVHGIAVAHFPYYWTQSGLILDLATNPLHRWHKLYILQNFDCEAGLTGFPAQLHDWQWQARYDFLLSGQVVWTTSSRWAVSSATQFSGVCHSRFGDNAEPYTLQFYGHQPQLGRDALEVFQRSGYSSCDRFILRPAYVPAVADRFRAHVDFGPIEAALSGRYNLSVWLHSSSIPF